MPRTSNRPDPFERAIEAALRPGQFIPYGAASALIGTRPDLADRASRALGARILKAKKSRDYEAALDHLERARRCYPAAGLTDSWQKVVKEIRAWHSRKTGFMGRFEAMLVGSRLRPEMRFLDRAKARWARRPTT